MHAWIPTQSYREHFLRNAEDFCFRKSAFCQHVYQNSSCWNLSARKNNTVSHDWWLMGNAWFRQPHVQKMDMGGSKTKSMDVAQWIMICHLILHAGAGNFATVGGKYGTQKVELNYSLPTLVAVQEKKHLFIWIAIHPGKICMEPKNGGLAQMIKGPRAKTAWRSRCVTRIIRLWGGFHGSHFVQPHW